MKFFLLHMELKQFTDVFIYVKLDAGFCKDIVFLGISMKTIAKKQQFQHDRYEKQDKLVCGEEPDRLSIVEFFPYLFQHLGMLDRNCSNKPTSFSDEGT